MLSTRREPVRRVCTKGTAPAQSKLMAFHTVAIVVGVNDTPGATPLRNAENDARDLASFLTGPQGPVGPKDLFLLVGPNATHHLVETAFCEAARRSPDLLFVVFSGHGSTRAICLADGVMDHAFLAAGTRQVRAKRAAVVIDACHAGAFSDQLEVASIGEELDDSWQMLFAQMMPGVRLLLASRADEVASDGQHNNGTFTSGLLTGLRVLRGNVLYAGRAYITAEVLFRYAARFVQKNTNGRQTPIAFGPIADFPIARAEAKPIAAPASLAPGHPPAPKGNPGLRNVLALVAVGVGAYAFSKRPKWDSGIGRYRGYDGRFW